ncbi:MAG: heavy metal translocating P-type ATPase [Oscillospiraceae bacterium]
MIKEKFNIEGMSCSACSAAVEKAASRLDGVKVASVNLLGKTMFVEYNEKVLSPDDIIKAVTAIGFSAILEPKSDKKDIVKNTAPAPDNEFTNVKTRLIVSLCFLIPLMYVAMGHMIGLPFTRFFHEVQNAIAFGFTQFLLTLPIIYVNRKFFFVGFKALWRKSPNMDSLIAVGSTAALVYGVFSIYMMGHGLGTGNSDLVNHYMMNLYFESAGMILTLVTVGKFLEERSKGKTNTAITKLMDLSPKEAVVLRGGIETTVSVEEIVMDDIIIIRPGEKIPVDGVIIEGASSLDQSALTGESIPVDKSLGDTVMSASINIDGTLKIKATKVGKDTTLAHIIELVENASSSKAPIARLADKVSGIFVPIVMLIAVLSVVIWLILGQGFEFSLGIGIAVLVVSCPCALGLATPVAIMVAMGQSASKGILVKSAESLEILHSVNTVVLDKTGTITVGKPSVTDIIPLIDTTEFINIAVALESYSEHPLSKAVCEYAKNFPSEKNKKAENFKAIFGKGITATIDGQKYFAGNKSYMTELLIDTSSLTEKANLLSHNGKTPLYFAKEGKFLGIIAVADTIKPSSFEAINRLKALKVKVLMLTGDNVITANAIKGKLSIDEVIADVLPENKEQIIKKLQNNKNIVAMVGDGINDSPALSRADVGIAVGNGTDIAIDSADIVLMKNDLNDVANAIIFSKKVMRNIKQNLFWAFFYNVLGIPIAAGILFIPFGIILSPMIAAAAMSFSSIFVVTNALRLYKS